MWDSVCRIIYLFPRCCFSISDVCVIVYDLGSMKWGVQAFWKRAQAERKPWMQNKKMLVPSVASGEW